MEVENSTQRNCTVAKKNIKLWQVSVAWKLAILMSVDTAPIRRQWILGVKTCCFKTN